MITRHLHVTGTRARDRAAVFEPAVAGRRVVVAHCHRRLRGPYTGVDTVLAEILPDAQRRWPDLVAFHRLELLDGMPQFAGIIGPVPMTLAADAPMEERTRWYNELMVRCMNQGMITFLREYARRVTAAGGELPVLVFDDVHEADRTTADFVALFVRRVDATLWPVVVGGTGDVDADLAAALAGHADQRDAPTLPAEPAPGTAADWVDSDGTSDDPAALDAYLALAPAERAALHDRRADELAAAGVPPGLLVGSLPFHRGRGSDPGGAGVGACLAAAEYATRAGFTAMVVELCEQGRALADPDADPERYRKLSHLLIAQIIGLRRLDEAIALCGELRRRYAEPLVHMTTSYFLAMIYTRFTEPRQHDLAVEWENNAIAIASGLPDPKQRTLLTGFQENGMALIEMHRRNLDRALELVDGVLARLDGELEPGEWVLHRSQLVYNRTRLLGALHRYDEAYAGFTALIDMDPHYTDYLSERAKISRKLGDLTAVLADYDLAIEIGPPFPEVFHNRAAVYVELGEPVKAMADFDLVLDMEPDDAETRLSRAELHYAQGDADAALVDVEHGLLLRPADARMLCLRGMIRLDQGAPEAALPDFDAALAADPAYPAALVNRATARFELDRPADSVADLTEALTVLGDDPDVLLNRGIALAACGRGDAALADFDLALTLPDCDMEELRDHRAELITSRGDAVATA
jgi:tetratricopeptide (TPR) repeat protein